LGILLGRVEAVKMAPMGFEASVPVTPVEEWPPHGPAWALSGTTALLLLWPRRLTSVYPHLMLSLGNPTEKLANGFHLKDPQIYRVSKEERPVFWEVIVSVIPSKKVYIVTCYATDPTSDTKCDVLRH
jgi:hypothetical protein